MDNKQIPDLREIIISNEPAGKTVDGSLQASLKDVAKYFNSFVRAAESAKTATGYLQTVMKEIVTEGKGTGLYKQKIIVDAKDLPNVLAALHAKNADMMINKEWSFDIATKQANVIKGTMQLVGKEAVKMAQAEAQLHGGNLVASPTKKYPNRYSYYYTTDETPDNKRYIFKDALKASRQEKQRLQTIEEEKIEKERLRKEQREAEKQEAERVRKANREAAERKAKERRIVDSIGKTLIALMTLTIDLLRRISVKSLNTVTQLSDEARASRDLGIDPRTARRMALFEKHHGIASGTTMGALSDLQAKFGNITNLDQNALNSLVMVMGGGIKGLVTSGLGGSAPDKLLSEIMNAYFAKYKSGKDILGQSVGFEQSRRSLISSLQEVSPEMAAIFSKMIDDFNSGFYGNFGGFDEYLATSANINRSALSEVEEIYAEEIKKKYDAILAGLEAIKTNFLTRFSFTLGDLIDKIGKLRIGLTPEENIALDIENKEGNAVVQKQVDYMLKKSELGAQSALRGVVAENPLVYEEDALAYNHLSTAIFPLEYVIKAMQGDLSNKDVINLAKKGELGQIGLKQGNRSKVTIFTADEWLKRAKQIGRDAAKLDPSFAVYWYASNLSKNLLKEGSKAIGSGIDLVDLMSPSEFGIEMGSNFQQGSVGSFDNWADMSPTRKNFFREAMQRLIENENFDIASLRSQLLTGGVNNKILNALRLRLGTTSNISSYSEENILEQLLDMGSVIFSEGGDEALDALFGTQNTRSALNKYIDSSLTEQVNKLRNQAAIDFAKLNLAGRLANEVGSYYTDAKYGVSNREGNSYLTIRLEDSKGVTTELRTPIPATGEITNAGTVTYSEKSFEFSNTQ